MSTDKEQIKFNYDHSVYLLGEIKSDMKIINTRSIWLLGILALITLGLADFLFRDFGTPTNIVGNIDDRFIKVYSALLLIHDFALILFTTSPAYLYAIAAFSPI